MIPFRELVEQLCDGPRLELFARRRRDGWTCLGNELPEEPHPEIHQPETPR